MLVNLREREGFEDTFGAAKGGTEVALGDLFALEGIFGFATDVAVARWHAAGLQLLALDLQSCRVCI